MIYLNEGQCAQLDRIIEAFGSSNSLDGEKVLAIEPMERKANGLIDVLEKRGFVKRINAEGVQLPLVMFLNPSASIFMDSGGFKAEFRRQLEQGSTTHVSVHSAGNNNLINTGNHNIIHATFNVLKGDVESLKDELARNKVEASDIAEIVTIVEEEGPLNNSLGPGTKNWIRKMLDKSMEGSWEITLATAGGVLTEILKKYYGL